MYSFAQRTDTQVVDEPLYAHYLANIDPTAHRPYREEVLAAQNNDGNAVLSGFINGSHEKPVVFLKHMAKQSKLLDMSFLRRTRNVILIRHPAEVLSSWSSSLGVNNTRMEDIGVLEQRDLFRAILAAGHEEPIVVSNHSLITRPEGTLRALCERLGLAFDPAMLHWPAGGRREDGLWARYWYHSTHASTGFSPDRQARRWPRASARVRAAHSAPVAAHPPQRGIAPPPPTHPRPPPLSPLESAAARRRRRLVVRICARGVRAPSAAGCLRRACPPRDRMCMHIHTYPCA